MTGILDAALDFATRGVPVFPCGRDKRPLTAHGFHDATTDEAQIRRWWAEHPDAAIGLPTGPASGLAVLDVDGPDGEESLFALTQEVGQIPETSSALTPHGRHLYFRYNGTPIRSVAGFRGLAGLDVRGDGGYVIAPPSVGYRWEISNTLVVDAPLWLTDTAAPRRETADEPTPILQGARNAALTSLGGSMRARGMSEAAIRAALLEENAARCEPALPDDEVEAIAKSVSRYEPQEGPRLRRGEAPTRHNDQEVRRQGPEVRIAARPLPRMRGDELVAAADTSEELRFLPLLGVMGFIVFGWSHLLSGLPRVGKTELLMASIRLWLDSGLRVLWLSEEPVTIWKERMRGREGDWSALTVIFGRGTDPEQLRTEAFDGPDEVVILDTLRNLLALEDETNNSEIVRVVTPWTATAAAAGRTLIAGHHDRKSGGEHGTGIAGGGALVGAFDIALQIIHDPSKPDSRRILRGFPRVIDIPTQVYERDEDGEMRMLGDPGLLRLEDVKRRCEEALGESDATTALTTTEVRERLEDPRPGTRQIQKALAGLLESGLVQRDPPAGERTARRTLRWWRS